MSNGIAGKRRRAAVLAVAGLAAIAVLFGAIAGAAPPAADGSARSQAARRLLDYLHRIQGSNILAGQHDYLEAPDAMVEAIHRLTGRYPALHGYELGAIEGQTDAKVRAARQRVVESAKRWWAAGGIVEVTYHARYPGGCYCWNQVQRRTSDAELAAVLTPGSSKNIEFLNDIDAIASDLQELQNAGVPVLFRPFHEMNGRWFWWGDKRMFADLWSLTYRRLVSYHGLRNLVWVWSPNAVGQGVLPYAGFYPGDDLVDVVALDIYGGRFKQQTYDDLRRFAAGKPIAIGENGKLPTPRTLASQPDWSWQMTWGKLALKNNTPQALSAFYADPRVVSREQLPAGL